MSDEPYIRISITELRKLAREAGRAGAEAAMGKLADQQDRVLRHVEQSGAHKATMNTQEAKRYAGVSDKTIRRWVRQGLPHNDRGGSAGFAFAKRDIDAWLVGQRAADRPPSPSASATTSVEGVVPERRP